MVVGGALYRSSSAARLIHDRWLGSPNISLMATILDLAAECLANEGVQSDLRNSVSVRKLIP